MEANFNSVESEPPKLVNSNIGSLLFADDLLVISESKEGLQNSINKLSDFCDNWQLRERPFNLKGGGGVMLFFLKKYSDSQCC